MAVRSAANCHRISHIQRPARNLLDRYGWAPLERLAARVHGFCDALALVPLWHYLAN